VQILQRYLSVVWGVETTKLTRKVKLTDEKSEEGSEVKYRVYNRIYLTTSELQKFLIIIMSDIPVKSMRYKAELKYKDKELQQR